MSEEEYNARLTAFAMWAIQASNGEETFPEKIAFIRDGLREFMHYEMLYAQREMMRGYQKSDRISGYSVRYGLASHS